MRAGACQRSFKSFQVNGSACRNFAVLLGLSVALCWCYNESFNLSVHQQHPIQIRPDWKPARCLPVFPCDAIHKRALCRHAVCVCPSVCPSVTFVNSVKTSNRILRLSSPSGIQTILVFAYQTLRRYSNRHPINVGVEYKGVWKNRDFRLIYRFISEMTQDRAIVTMEGE